MPKTPKKPRLKLATQRTTLMVVAASQTAPTTKRKEAVILQVINPAATITKLPLKARPKSMLKLKRLLTERKLMA